MKKSLLILTFLLIQISLGATYKGGIWLEGRTVGFTTEMRTSYQPQVSDGSGGSVLLSRSLFTMIDSIASGDSAYTRGIGYDYKIQPALTSPDTLGSDTSWGVELDGFIDQDVQVNMFVMWLASDSILVTIEQALSYDPPAYDTAVAYGVTGSKFNRGFVVTDTLFYDSLVTAKDKMMTIATDLKAFFLVAFLTTNRHAITAIPLSL